MAAEQVLHHRCHAAWVGFAQRLELLVELCGGNALLVAEEELVAGEGEVVVHHRVELVALQVGHVEGHVADVLGHQVGLWVDRLDQRAPALPEAVRQPRRHVQPPAVDAAAHVALRRHPAARHCVHVGQRTLGQGAGFLAQFGQAGVAAPGLVLKALRVVAPRRDLEPASKARLALVLYQVQKRPVAHAHMVEHAVEDDAHAARMRLGNQLEHQPVGAGPDPGGGVVGHLQRHQRAVARRVGAKVGVYVVQRGGVVLVVRWRVEHRVQVQRVHAQLLQVRQALQDAGNVAAVAPVGQVVLQRLAAGALPGLQCVPVAGPGVGAPAGVQRAAMQRALQALGRGVVAQVAVAKALGEDLVPDGVAGPLRGEVFRGRGRVRGRGCRRGRERWGDRPVCHRRQALRAACPA